LSRELARRRSMLARYHTMLAKAALRREALKQTATGNPTATRTHLTEFSLHCWLQS
jgi:hypothetical protein